MGGGNGLKSHMAKNKKQVVEKKGGGGAAGITDRRGGGAVICAICKTNFSSVKMVVQMRDHQGSKHPKQTLAECFVGIDF